LSWDVSIHAANIPPAKFEELGGNWDTIPLGSCESVRQRLSILSPDIDWTDREWGYLQGHGYSIEFNLGDNEPCDGVMLHIRGSGENNNLFEFLRNIQSKAGWYVLDHTQNEWLHHGANPEVGLRAFNEMGNDVLTKLNQEAHEAKPLWKRLFGL
jgi:hypothetical protein